MPVFWSDFGFQSTCLKRCFLFSLTFLSQGLLWFVFFSKNGEKNMLEESMLGGATTSARVPGADATTSLLSVLPLGAQRPPLLDPLPLMNSSPKIAVVKVQFRINYKKQNTHTHIKIFWKELQRCLVFLDLLVAGSKGLVSRKGQNS